MKKVLFQVFAVFMASQLWAAQQPLTEISIKQSNKGLREAINAQVVAPVQDNFTQIWEALNGSPWLAQTTAPSIHNVFWIDTTGAPPTIKYWDGDSWEVAAASGDGTYTLPVASAEALGGVKVGDRLTITDGVLSADVQTTDISGKEDSLGNPSTNGYVLSSTTAGVRSWVEMTGGGPISLSAEQDWLAVQNFNSGITATGIELTLSALSDVKFGADNWVDDTKTSGHLNYLWSSKYVFDKLALKSDATHNHTGTYEPADSTIIKVAEIDSLAEFEALLGWSPGSGGSFAFDTFPTYEDSAHTSGIAVNGTTLAVYSTAASKWLTVGLTDSLNPAPVTYAATLTLTDSSATGDTFTLNSIAYDVADSPVSITNLPTATEVITYTGSNTANCTGDVTGTADTGPWTINATPATIECTVTEVSVSETIGTSTQGSTQSTINSAGYAFFMPIVGVLANNGPLSSYTVTLRQQTGSRTISVALYTYSGGTMTKVSGSDTGTITYAAATDKTDVTLTPIGSASLLAGEQYYAGFKFGGYTALYGNTAVGGVLRKTDPSELDATYTALETDPLLLTPGKLQITVGGL